MLNREVGYVATTATSCLAEESSADVIIQIAKPVLEQKKLYLITKRAFDIVCSSLGLLILAIPMLIIALLVTLDSPGSPIFKQERLGLHGKPFIIYKFRSINLNNKASHNTLIQVVYQFGLIGMPLLISWVVISLRNLFTQLNAGHVKWKHALLMCVGVVLPWMGIDILQFDEFFLLPVYAVIGIAYSTRSTENKKLESSKGEI